MIIETARIPPEGSHYTGEDPGEVLELGAESGVRVGDALRYDLRAEIISGGVVVHGRVWMNASLQCGRCAEFFSTLLTEPDFLRDYPLREGQQELDITADLREAVLLRLPPHPVCGEPCRGLCPRCGKNLNQGPCGCTPDTPADPGVWRALDDLTL